MEISGLNTGVDAGSEANSLTQTLNYTTAGANEYTVVGGMDAPGTVLAPGGTLTQATESSSSKFTTFRQLAMIGTTVASGANSTSMTGANSTPAMAGLSFGVSSPSGVLRKKGWIGE
jgi:hypothetical protein